MMIIKGGTLVYPNRTLKADILVKEGRIAKVARSIGQKGEPVVDASGLLVLPGLIDAHVHLREPGGTQKEDFRTGTMAALAGGVTTVLCMPNTNPSIDSYQLLSEWKVAAEKCACDYGFQFGAAVENGSPNLADAAKAAADPRVAALKVFMGSSTGKLLVKDFAPLFTLFAAWPKEKPVAAHCEDEDAVKFFSGILREKKGVTAADHNRARPPICAELAVKRAIAIAAATKRRLHVCHASTAAELEAVRQAKKAGLLVTCEAAPHHLFLTEADAARLGNFAKMNPPLRSQSDVKAAWDGIADGTVDCIATDHAPHTIEEKSTGYWDAPSGVPGLETMLPLLLDAAVAKRITVEKIVELCCANPARIFGLASKGGLVPSADADIVLVDPRGKTRIDGPNLQTKCKWSPWQGKTLKGKIRAVYLRGEKVYDGHAVSPGAKGQPVKAR